MQSEEIVTGSEAKSCFKRMVEHGKVYGLIAYVNDQAAGWCAVDPLMTQLGHDYFLSLRSAPSPDSVWLIHCLYVAPRWRGLGVSNQLIQAAIQLSKESGASEILAFPIPDETKAKFPLRDAEFSGRMSTYLKLGFVKQERLNDFYQKVRLVLLDNCL